MVSDRRGPGTAFLLAQVGAAAAERFGQALTELELTPPLAGLLRQLSDGAPRSQQQLAQELGTAPSRIVAYLDDLEHRAAVQRRPGPDRRVNVVTLTDSGRELLRRLDRVARAHEQRVTAGLTAQQRATLQELLATVAAGLDLTTGVHSGYRAPVRRRP